MVFGSGVACQDRDTPAGAVTPSANAMMFARKTQTGFAAVYVTYPNQSNYGKPGYNARNGGLQQNSFHCHVVGRWK